MFTNQFGQPMSLSQFRGKVVMLAFEDSQCTTVCPLTTQSMLEAKQLLGAAGNQVQLLGIVANPAATSVAAVLAYSRSHGLVNQWDFLTGSLAQLKTIWGAPKPVIGRINGHAFGGGIGLTAACDLTVAADSATFAFSEVRVGVIPAIISVLCVPKLGVQNAMWLFLTGERFSAARAVEVGLVHRAVPAAELDAAVEEVIGLVRRGGPNAVREAKQLVRRIPRLSLDDGFRWTAAKSGELFRSEEAAEGMQAFVQKRKPRWAE